MCEKSVILCLCFGLQDFFIHYICLFFQTVFSDQPQVAYIQQDGTTQQVMLQYSVVYVLS